MPLPARRHSLDIAEPAGRSFPMSIGQVLEVHLGLVARMYGCTRSLTVLGRGHHHPPGTVRL